MIIFSFYFFFSFTQSKLVMWWGPLRKKTPNRIHSHTLATSNMACETTQTRDTVNHPGGRSGSKKPTQSSALTHCLIYQHKPR